MLTMHEQDDVQRQSGKVCVQPNHLARDTRLVGVYTLFGCETTDESNRLD